MNKKKTKEINVWDVFSEMSRVGDKGIQLAPLSNISKEEIKGVNGFVTFGVPASVVQERMIGGKEYVGGFLLVEKTAFDRIKKTLE